MLLQRKNDSRDASSRSPTRYARAGARRAPARARSGRGTADRRGRARPPAGCRDSNDAALAPVAIELQQRLHVGTGGGNRPAVGARGERRQDLARARRLVGCRRRRADEQAPAARRVAGPGRVERAGDGDLRDAGRARRRRGRRRPRPRVRVRDDQRGRDRVRSRRHLQARRAASLQRRRACRRGSRRDRRRAVRPPAAPPRRAAAGLPDLQVVLGVERERVANDDAAARAERQPVDVRVLRQIAGHPVGRAIETDRRIADARGG